MATARNTTSCDRSSASSSGFFATVALAGQALAASGDEDAMGRWLPGIADGSVTAALAVAENSGSWDLAEVAATAEPATAGP